MSRTMNVLRCGAIAVTLMLWGNLRVRAASPDALVAVGAGQAGAWATQVNMANLGGTPYIVQLGLVPLFQAIVACPGPCPIVQATIAARGTTPFSDELAVRGAQGQFSTLYITPDDGTSLPAVRMWTVNGDNPAQTVPVPVYRLSTLVALNPSVLSFPGAVRSSSGAARSNLALANLNRTDGGVQDGVTLAIEAIAHDGTTLGSTTVTLQYGQTVYLVDVLASIGVTTLDNGELQVTRTAGAGIFWGMMATRDANGAVVVSSGASP